MGNDKLVEEIKEIKVEIRNLSEVIAKGLEDIKKEISDL